MRVDKCALHAVWTHHHPVRVAAGHGVLNRLRELTPAGKILLVTTAGFTRRGMTEKIKQQLGASRVIVNDQVSANPELDFLDQTTKQFKNQAVAGLVALGGGSVMDTGKILALTLLSELRCPLDHVLRKACGHEWINKIPVIAIPTTAGTGAEATPFATVWDKSTYKKYSLSGPLIFPDHALLDPELTLSLPRHETLYSGLDAVSHALESLWNFNRTPISEAYALQALNLANQALPMVLEQPDLLEQRALMQHASLLAGMAISQTRTAIAHAISYPLTVRYGVPHGLACSFTLVEIWEHCRVFAGNIFETESVVQTINLLRRLDLRKELKKHINMNDILAVIPEMDNKSRTENFTAFNDKFAVREIVGRAIG